jgi:hypothetical protein
MESAHYAWRKAGFYVTRRHSSLATGENTTPSRA